MSLTEVDRRAREMSADEVRADARADIRWCNDHVPYGETSWDRFVIACLTLNLTRLYDDFNALIAGERNADDVWDDWEASAIHTFLGLPFQGTGMRARVAWWRFDRRARRFPNFLGEVFSRIRPTKADR